MTPPDFETITSHEDIQKLYHAARTILDAPDGVAPELRSLLEGPVRELEAMAVFRDGPIGQKVLERAKKSRNSYDDGYLKINQEDIVYHDGDYGYWVQSWLFVPDIEVEDNPEEDDDEHNEPLDPDEIPLGFLNPKDD